MIKKIIERSNYRKKRSCCDSFAGQYHALSCPNRRPRFFCCGIHIRPGEKCSICGEEFDKEKEYLSDKL